MNDELNCAIWAISDSLPQHDDGAYGAWIRQRATLTSDDVQSIRLKLAKHVDRPWFSLIVADCGDDDAWRRTAASLCGQIYRHFQLVVACPDSRVDALERIVAAAKAPKFVIRSCGSSSTETTQAEARAADAADGDFVTFLAPGDRLAPEALAEIALALDRLPETVVFYVDDDWADAAGNRSRPNFKAAWDPDAQLGYDLFGRFSPIRREVFESEGGLRPEHGVVAHYDLHCRVAETAGPLRIAHIPAVLHHRGQPSGTTEPRTSAETYARRARGVARQAALRSEGKHVEVRASSLAPFMNRIVWPLPDHAPLVSILVPTRDRAELLSACALGVLKKTDYPNLELLVLDNGSIEPETFALFDQLTNDRRVSILSMPGPFNYSKLNNDGAAAAKGELILLLNNDIEILNDQWLSELVSHAVRPDVGCVGARLLYADRRIQHAGVTMGPHSGCAHVGRLTDRTDPGLYGGLAVTRTYSAVTAACLAIRKSVFEEVGGLDADNLAIGYNDVDLCLKVGEHGYRVILTPFAELFHLESVSRGPNDNPKKRAQDQREQATVIARWRGTFLDDPYQSPNVLATWGGYAALAAPRRARGWADAACVEAN